MLEIAAFRMIPVVWFIVFLFLKTAILGTQFGRAKECVYMFLSLITRKTTAWLQRKNCRREKLARSQKSMRNNYVTHKNKLHTEFFFWGGCCGKWFPSNCWMFYFDRFLYFFLERKKEKNNQFPSGRKKLLLTRFAAFCQRCDCRQFAGVRKDLEIQRSPSRFCHCPPTSPHSAALFGGEPLRVLAHRALYPQLNRRPLSCSATAGLLSRGSSCTFVLPYSAAAFSLHYEEKKKGKESCLPVLIARGGLEARMYNVALHDQSTVKWN